MYTCKMGPNWFLYKRLQLYPTIAKIHTPPFMNSKNTQKQDKKQNKTHRSILDGINSPRWWLTQIQYLSHLKWSKSKIKKTIDNFFSVIHVIIRFVPESITIMVRTIPCLYLSNAEEKWIAPNILFLSVCLYFLIPMHNPFLIFN